MIAYVTNKGSLLLLSRNGNQTELKQKLNKDWNELMKQKYKTKLGSQINVKEP